MNMPNRKTELFFRKSRNYRKDKKSMHHELKLMLNEMYYFVQLKIAESEHSDKRMLRRAILKPSYDPEAETKADLSQLL